MGKLATMVAVMVFGLCSISASAQYFGVRAGVGISNLLTSSETSSFGRLFSTQLGGTIDFELSDRFYLQSGVTFFKKGGAGTVRNVNLYYFELPVTARFDFLEIGREGSLYARAGFYSGLLLAADIDGDALEIGNKVGDDIKFFDFGLITGVGYGFNESIDVGLVFEFGFLNLEPNQNNISLSNGAIMVSANYRFGM
ncbi:MAG: porin family protein [Pricia sp.]